MSEIGITSPSRASVALLIADDDEVTRSGLRTLLAAQPGITVVGEAADGVEAVAQARRLRPDVVLMDVRMPRSNGIEATRQLLAESAEPPKVVVITTFENDGYVTAALSAGASGFVLKRLPVRQIAESLTVSLETVKTHVGNVLTKLGAQNRTHAVVIAYESGLVVPGFAG
ncbi:response regulator [Kitasatospora sp. NPDC004669]|uniref:response regulator transcription factor n=1 Tax=Kitasatospora sp. NPDC004669 TaxID=3154555 RepID=UPI0033A0F737